MGQGSILHYLQPKPQADRVTGSEESQTSSVESGEPDGYQTHDGTQLSKNINAQNVVEEICMRVSAGIKDPMAVVTYVQPDHLERLVSITATLLPVRYSDKFFKECLDQERNDVVAFVALYDSKPVGWIRSRLEPFPNEENKAYTQVYVQALGVLAPYRGMGLAKALLDATIDAGSSQRTDFKSIAAHVWESNQDALTWYERQSFHRVMLQSTYYRRLKPSGAWIVRRNIDRTYHES